MKLAQLTNETSLHVTSIKLERLFKFSSSDCRALFVGISDKSAHFIKSICN
jgi:hypothetical protein